MKRVIAVLVALVAAAVVALPSAATAAGPPVPKEVRGKKVNVYATGVAVPTQYTFAGKKMFIAGAGEGKAPGGIFVRRPGSKQARKVPGTGKNAFGVALRHHKLYASLGTKLMVYSKWNGKRFRRHHTLFKPPAKRLTGFNGIAFGPDGRLYAGLTMEFDNAASKRHYANCVISIRRNGHGAKIVSRGLRQPWMMAFARGDRYPIVSDLAQDTPPGVTAPDLLVKARPTTNFGFPTCNWATGSPCKGFSHPFMKLPQVDGRNPSPMGIAAKGKKLYVALFNGEGKGPEVVSTTTRKTPLKPVLTGFAAPVLSVASHRGFLYAGDLTGRIYRVHN